MRRSADGRGRPSKTTWLVPCVPLGVDFAPRPFDLVHLPAPPGTPSTPYDDQLELGRWQTVPWAFTQSAVESAAEDTLTLNPAALAAVASAPSGVLRHSRTVGIVQRPGSGLLVPLAVVGAAGRRGPRDQQSGRPVWPASRPIPGPRAPPPC